MPASRTWIVLDTETATPEAPRHLLELGAVRLEQGRIVARFTSLVRPSVSVDPRTSAVHGIREEHLIDAPAPAEVLARFAEWCAGAQGFVAHDARFDADVLGGECARTGIELPALVFFDTLRLSRKAFPAAPDHRLQTLCEELGIERLRRHRALDDAQACSELFLRCGERLSAALFAKAGLARGLGFTRAVSRRRRRR